jgi:hypothetical protein
LHLLRVLSRLNAIIKPSVVGLMDITTNKDIMKAAVMAGTPLVHIKSSEMEAVVYDAICMAFHDALEDHGYATAQLSDNVNAYIPCKVGVLSPMGIRLESNFKIAEGSQYFLKTYWFEKGMIKSPTVFAANQYQYDIYYNYDYAQEFGFEFVPPPEFSEGTPPEVFEQRQKERDFAEAEAKERMSEWVDNNQKNSYPKKLKVLVIDKELNFFNEQPRTDEYDYVIRCQPYLKYVKKELLHDYAQLIVYNLEEVDTEELEANEDLAFTFNETRTLQYIVKVIRSIEGYNPYIIIFNSKDHDTKKLQKLLNYNGIVAYKEMLTPELVIKMAGMLESKLSANFQEYEVPTVVINKKDMMSYAEFQLPVTILAASEQDLYFTSEIELKENTVLRMELHGAIHVTVAPPPKSNLHPTAYYGLIHGVSEKDKMELRRWVNSVFFRQLEDQKKAEKEEVAKVKQQAIERKKKEEEEAARLAAEKAEQERLMKEEEERSKKEQKEAAERLGNVDEEKPFKNVGDE